MSEIIIYDSDDIIEPLPDIEITFDDNFNSLEESAIQKSGKIKISVDGPGQTDNGYINKPYFKVYKGSSFKTSSPKDRARISFDGANYVEHTTDPALWKLNAKERKQLVDILKSEPKSLPNTLNNYDTGVDLNSVWLVGLAVANAESSIDPKDIEKKGISMKKKIPDYENGIGPENEK